MDERNAESISMPRNLMDSWREKLLGVAFDKYCGSLEMET